MNNQIINILSLKTGRPNSEIRRLIKQKAIKINGETINDFDAKVNVGDTIRIGNTVQFQIIYLNGRGTYDNP